MYVKSGDSPAGVAKRLGECLSVRAKEVSGREAGAFVDVAWVEARLTL